MSSSAATSGIDILFKNCHGKLFQKGTLEEQMLCLCAHWTGTSLRRSEQPKHGILQYPIDGAYIPIKSEKDIQRLLDCFNDLLNKGVCPTKIFIDPEITIPGPRHWDLPRCQTRFLTFNKNDKASFENFKPTAVHAMLFGWFNNMRYFKADVIQIVPADVRNRLRVNFHNILHSVALTQRAAMLCLVQGAKREKVTVFITSRSHQGSIKLLNMDI